MNNKQPILLTRNQFREAVFERDNHTCVFCELPAVDAHHIIERRLWPDGGYYIANGASVCAEHHLQCEMTLISVEDVRRACNIERAVLPEHMYDDTIYDKWGNVVLEDGRRLRGELFSDESVQKILERGGVLPLFVKYIKYGRTFHLPTSPGIHDDDRMMPNDDHFKGQHVVMFEKLDGENTTVYNDYIHARSITSGGHPSRDWIKAFHSYFCGDIPEGWRINLENMYAEHSIRYPSLDTYAYGFAMWDATDHILAWEETLDWFDLLGITPCPTLYIGQYDANVIQETYERVKRERELRGEEIEGFVVRIDKRFHMRDFRHNIGKYVRKGHVQTTKHWMWGQAVKPNILKDGLTGFEKVMARYGD